MGDPQSLQLTLPTGSCSGVMWLLVTMGFLPGYLTVVAS